MSSFFNQLASFNATPYAKAKIAKATDPLQAAKLKFAKQADEQVKKIKSAADKGLWFKREGESVIVSLKNGVAVINKDNPSFAFPDAASAVKFIEAAKEACAKGEFDDLMRATLRGPRKPKAAASEDSSAAAPASAQEPAPAPKAPGKRK